MAGGQLPLGPETALRVSPDASLQVQADGQVIAHLRDVHIPCGSEGLEILALFTTPRTYQAALQELQSRVATPYEWVRLSATIAELASAGILEVEGTTPRAPDDQGPNWAPPAPHIAMLNDVTRTVAFRAALQELVGPDDVVVDIGTGTGVLAASAARAGARHVYAIEATGAADYATALFTGNQLEERVTLLRGWSSRIDLPQRGTVLVTETLGNDPFEEHLLDLVVDARNRLLVPDARIIPSRVRVFAGAFEVSDKVLSARRFTEPATGRWSQLYDLDFAPLAATPGPGFFKTSSKDVQGWRQAGDLVELADVDLQHLDRPLVDASGEITVDDEATVNAVAVFFDAVLSQTQTVTTRPDEVAVDNHWSAPVWLLPSPIARAAGQRIEVRYRSGGAIRTDEKVSARPLD